MKTKYILLSTTLFLSNFLLSSYTQAQQADKPNIEVKCFVDLYGGGQSIYFARLSESEFQRLPVSLVGRKVYTTDRNTKIKVYAVRECVLDKNKFKSLTANNLESTMTK